MGRVGGVGAGLAAGNEEKVVEGEDGLVGVAAAGPGFGGFVEDGKAGVVLACGRVELVSPRRQKEDEREARVQSA